MAISKVHKVGSLLLLVICGLSACPAGENVMEQNKGELKKAIQANAVLSPSAKELAISTLIPLTTNKVFVEAVKAQNAKKMTLDEIKAIDKKWQDAEEEMPLMKELSSNPVAKEIREVVAKNAMVLEAFVMDNQGANVGLNQVTSDYWQGDEPKWQNSFNNGKGGVDVGKPGFDKSANAQIIQVSLPIMDSTGEVVGAITWGIKLE